MSPSAKQPAYINDSERTAPKPRPLRMWLTFRWRQPRVVLGLFIFELAPTIAGLALFGIADPDLYRTRLWQDGYLNGFNSSPAQVLLAYANHVPFTVPLVWSQFITTFNLVISVLSMFWLLVKSIAFVLDLWPPLFSLTIHSGLFSLYLYSVYAQTSPDKTDPNALQNGPPWYITHSCSVAYYKSDVGYCRQAKAALAVCIIMVILFFVNMCQSLVSCFPTQQEQRDHMAGSGDKVQESRPTYSATSFPPPPAQRKSGFVSARPFGLGRMREHV